MGKEILTFGNIETWKKKNDRRKPPIFLGDVDIENVKNKFNKIYFGEKPLSTLLVACIMIIKLDHCI